VAAGACEALVDVLVREGKTDINAAEKVSYYYCCSYWYRYSYRGRGPLLVAVRAVR
jgi:hypothetical protein